MFTSKKMQLKIKINIFAIIPKSQYGDFSFQIIWKFVENVCSQEFKKGLDLAILRF